jgi:alkylated DNA nucleotide flippase Atl1
VVKSNGEIGGFADDINVKIKRLHKEGVEVLNNKVVNFKSILFSES